MSKQINIDVSIDNKSQSYGNSRTYRFTDEHEGCFFRLQQVPFPECCGVTILKSYSMTSDLSNSEFRKCMDLLVEDLAKNDKFAKIIIYTNTTSNMARMMAEYPEVIITDKFKNPRSGNTLIGFEYMIPGSEDKNPFQGSMAEDMDFFIPDLISQQEEVVRPSQQGGLLQQAEAQNNQFNYNQLEQDALSDMLFQIRTSRHTG